MIKTPEYREYELLVALWATKNALHLEPARVDLAVMKFEHEEVDKTFAIRCDLYFCFPNLITKQKRPRVLDLDNRVKPALDSLKKVLGIDDKHVFAGYFEKVSTHSKDSECIIRLSAQRPRTRQQVLMDFHLPTTTATK